MEIHVLDLIEYMECPRRYKFRKDGAPERQTMYGRGFYTGTNIYREFDQAMHKMAAYLFHMVEAGRYPSMHIMKQKWGKLWIDREGHEDAMQEITSWRDERRRKESQGLRSIINLMEEYRENPGVPILIGKEYEVKVGKHILKGSIDLVREVDGQIEIVDFKLDDRPTTLHTKNDLEVTAAAYAFRKLAGVKEDRIVYHGLISNKKQETTRGEKDLQMLELVLDQVEKAMEMEIFYPVLNFRCYECPFDTICAKREWVDDAVQSSTPTGGRGE